MSKKVGIITMHRVLNPGSVLQAYALYKQVCKMGYECEIVDYQYPNAFHIDNNHGCKRGVSEKIKLLYQRIKFFILYRARLQKKRYVRFMDEYLSMSKFYSTKELLFKESPKYDVYLTGSDQVWNPKCMKGDDAFFCAWNSNGKKISYASSFSTSTIPDIYKEHYSLHLRKYDCLGVREQSAVEVIRNLTGKNSVVVCDPTMLLFKADYLPLLKHSRIHKNEPYILVYALTYAYNPYPQMDTIVKMVKGKMKLPVIYLYTNSVDNYHYRGAITSAGPCEFIDLFMHASFVVTSSFHGTAFALNFGVPFYSIVPDDVSADSRIMSLLQLVGASDRAIKVSQQINNVKVDMDYLPINKLIEEFRQDSNNFLKESLKH